MSNANPTELRAALTAYASIRLLSADLTAKGEDAAAALLRDCAAAFLTTGAGAAIPHSMLTDIQAAARKRELSKGQ